MIKVERHFLTIDYFIFASKIKDMFLSTNLMEFNRQFKDERICLAYLSEMKWKNGYNCHRCQCTKYGKGYRPYDRRCKECDYNESVTANTIFHKLKFNILTAFHIVFRLSSKKGLSTYEIAKSYRVNQKTAWLFKCKVQSSITNAQRKKLENTVEIDEFMVGGKDAKKQGRSKGDKKVAFISAEKISEDNVGSIRLSHIDSFSKKELTKCIDVAIEKKSEIIADKFSTYRSLEKEREHFKTIYSKNGQNFKSLHNVIMNLKSWLKGIHHKVSHFHFSKYLAEFEFRFNMRNFEKGIFNSIIQNMIYQKPVFAHQLRNSVA